MPSITINVEASIHERGPRVHVWLNGKHYPSIGPFATLGEADRAAGRVFAELTRCIVPTIEAPSYDDICDTTTQNAC